MYSYLSKKKKKICKDLGVGKKHGYFRNFDKIL